MIEKRQFYINGAWVDPATARDHEVINPATEEPCAIISLGDQADKLVFIPDGNGAFTEGMQALVSKGNKGMGMRSWRCVLIINENCVIEHGLVEAGLRGNASDDPYEETTPERCIGQLIMLDANNAAAEQADANIAHTFQELAAKV